VFIFSKIKTLRCNTRHGNSFGVVTQALTYLLPSALLIIWLISCLLGLVGPWLTPNIRNITRKQCAPYTITNFVSIYSDSSIRYSDCVYSMYILFTVFDTSTVAMKRILWNDFTATFDISIISTISIRWQWYSLVELFWVRAVVCNLGAVTSQRTAICFQISSLDGTSYLRLGYSDQPVNAA
jgi:hypothetical protein